ncbi:MAG: adenylate/guanylate cyclase domain-containing protein [Chloroflexota bacterium]|nr:adenylate/guanylate cyclase domain-containing protein [Chloroflexota bacterium]
MPIDLSSLANLGPFLPRFGDLLRDHRTLIGLSVEEVAAAAGIAPSALRELEANTRAAPPKHTVILLAEALRMNKGQRSDLLDAADMDAGPVRAMLGRDREPEGPKAPSAAIFVFLIADIRGYTRYTETYGDEAAARLATGFAELARAVFERWDGRLVEVRGDEALGAFASARQAVRAAGDLHASWAAGLAQHADWPRGVGVGLDIGEAVPVENGYRGNALNRAARLCSLAGPGETLISPGVVYVAPHVEGVRFVPRGQELLKGFPEPVEILQAAPQPVVDATETAPDPDAPLDE